MTNKKNHPKERINDADMPQSTGFNDNPMNTAKGRRNEIIARFDREFTKVAAKDKFKQTILSTIAVIIFLIALYYIPTITIIVYIISLIIYLINKMFIK